MEVPRPIKNKNNWIILFIWGYFSVSYYEFEIEAHLLEILFVTGIYFAITKGIILFLCKYDDSFGIIGCYTFLKEKYRDGFSAFLVIYLVGVVGFVVFYLSPEYEAPLYVLPVSMLLFFVFIILIILAFLSLGVVIRHLKSEEFYLIDRLINKKLTDLQKLEKDGKHLLFSSANLLSVSPGEFLLWFSSLLYYFIASLYSSFKLMAEFVNESIDLTSVLVGFMVFIAIGIQFYFIKLLPNIDLYCSGWLLQDSRTKETTRIGPKMIFRLKDTFLTWNFLLVTGFSGIIWFLEYLNTNDPILFLLENATTIGSALVVFSCMLFEGLILFLFQRRKVEKKDERMIILYEGFLLAKKYPINSA